MIEERLDRQLRIKGWDQVALSSARVCTLGDNDLLASFFALSASALGINDLVILAPSLDIGLVGNASRINPKFNLTFLQGYYTHSVMDDIFTGCGAIVDLTRYGLANKLLINKAYRDRVPVVRAFCESKGASAGIKSFTYVRGREWEELGEIVSTNNLPAAHFDDAVLDIIAAGIALENVKSILMGWRISPELISFETILPNQVTADPKVLVVGAGALGNFAALGLAYSGIKDITFMDPDLVEIANLNRQVLFYEAMGHGKAQTLAMRMNEKFAASAKFHAAYFDQSTDISRFDIIFDCVDNFETRILISEKCSRAGKVLISGGTSATAGQAIFYNAANGDATPAELLGLRKIVGDRIGQVERIRESCRYRPDPSVVMTNQIIAGLMVDAYRVFLNGNRPQNVFYDSESDEKIMSGCSRKAGATGKCLMTTF